MQWHDDNCIFKRSLWLLCGEQSELRRPRERILEKVVTHIRIVLWRWRRDNGFTINKREHYPLSRPHPRHTYHGPFDYSHWLMYDTHGSPRSFLTIIRCKKNLLV